MTQRAVEPLLARHAAHRHRAPGQQRHPLTGGGGQQYPRSRRAQPGSTSTVQQLSAHSNANEVTVRSGARSRLCCSCPGSAECSTIHRSPAYDDNPLASRSRARPASTSGHSSIPGAVHQASGMSVEACATSDGIRCHSLVRTSSYSTRESVAPVLGESNPHWCRRGRARRSRSLSDRLAWLHASQLSLADYGAATPSATDIFGDRVRSDEDLRVRRRVMPATTRPRSTIVDGGLSSRRRRS